jgi:hypothetical protein
MYAKNHGEQSISMKSFYYHTNYISEVSKNRTIGSNDKNIRKNITTLLAMLP